MEKDKDVIFDEIFKKLDKLRSIAYGNYASRDPAKSEGSELFSVEASTYAHAIEVVKKCFDVK